jgi:hypothetical protein
LHAVAGTTNPGRAMTRRMDTTPWLATYTTAPRHTMARRGAATSRHATAGTTIPRRAAAPGSAFRRIFDPHPLVLEEILRRHCQPLGGENPLGRVHDCGDCGTSLMSGESISLSNKLLDFRDLDRFGFLRVLDIGDPLVVVVSNPSKALAQTIDCVSALFKGVGFNPVFLCQIKLMFFALLKPKNEIIGRIALIC